MDLIGWNLNSCKKKILLSWTCTERSSTLSLSSKYPNVPIKWISCVVNLYKVYNLWHLLFGCSHCSTWHPYTAKNCMQSTETGRCHTVCQCTHNNPANQFKDNNILRFFLLKIETVPHNQWQQSGVPSLWQLFSFALHRLKFYQNLHSKYLTFSRKKYWSGGFIRLIWLYGGNSLRPLLDNLQATLYSTVFYIESFVSICLRKPTE